MRLDKFNKFSIFPRGTETLKLRIHGKKQEIPYLNSDEYNDLDDPILIGYASLKHSRVAVEEDALKNSKDVVGVLTHCAESDCDCCLSCNPVPISTIRKRKHKFKTIKGYFDVDNNQYVAIEKNSLFLFLIPILLILLIIGLCASCGGINNDDPDPTDPWQPTIEEDLGESSTTLFEQRNIEICGFSAWHVAVGETENIPITLKNPEANPCYFSFVITLEDSREEIYRSAMVKPGDTIRSININRPLEAGEYTASIQILTNELETGNSMNDACFEVALTVD